MATVYPTDQEKKEQDSYEQEGIKVALKADTLGYLGPIPVTNSLISSLLGSIVLIVLMILLAKKLKQIPGRIQSIFELAIDKGYEFALNTLDGNEEIAKKTFPLVLTFFVFILFFNLVKFIPGYESTFFGKYHLFKPIHADLNMTLALGITSFIYVQFVGMYVLGAKTYISKFINLKKPLSIPLGLIELVSEFAKMFSLSFRLFGNIFAGGILLLIAGSVTHYVLPVPVMLFEIFVAFLQAGIFALLTLVYVKLSVSEPH